MDDLRFFPIIELSANESYSYTAEEYDRMVQEEFKSLRQNREPIRLIQGRSARTVATIHACLLSDLPFAFLPPNAPESDFRPSWLVERIKSLGTDQTDLTRPLGSKEQICYTIRTSGSTGKPKLVAVPNRAIWPNIEDFKRRFQLTENDRILFSTSVFFDPSIVEIFLCMASGATMIVVPDEIRSSPHLLTRVIQQYKPTFIQMTPALFKMFSFTDENRNLMYSVRTLLLGGEKYPLQYLDQFRLSHFPNTNFYDVYGVTEVSCWATVYKVEKGCFQIPIGDAIDQTEIRIDSEGTVIIEGPRICYINGQQPSSHPTGDWALKTENGWILQGRLDNVKKINGIKLNLEDCSEVILSAVSELEFARFLLWKNDYLVLFVKFKESTGKTESELVSMVKRHSPPNLPVTVIPIECVPLNNNGKVDSEKLLEGLATVYTLQWRKAHFWQILAHHGITEGMSQAIPVDYGVKSLTAAELAILLGESATIREILSEETTVGQLVEKYLNKEQALEQGSDIPSHEVIVIPAPEPSLLWQYDMNKCIDGNPLLFRHDEEDYVVAASHSGMILCMNHTRQKLVWKHHLEERRLEASPALCDGKVVIGSYAGHLLVFDSLTGEKQDEIHFQDCSIRGEAASVRDVIFVVTYTQGKESSGAINMLRLRDRHLLSLPLAAGSTACPQIHDSFLYVTTIRGTIETFQFTLDDEMSLISIWKSSHLIAIFSPVVLEEDVLIATSANGQIGQFDRSNGEMKGSISLGEAFFSSVFSTNDIYLVASQKGNVFVLDKQSLVPLRKFCFPHCSFVKTPTPLSDNILVLVSKDGRLLRASLDNFSEERPFSCPSYRIGSAEIFLKPRFTADALIIGCRDDHLRAFPISDLL